MVKGDNLKSVFFFFLVGEGFIWLVKIISLSLSPASHDVGRKWEIPKKKHLTVTCKLNLAYLVTHSGEMTSDSERLRLVSLTTQPRLKS